MLFAAGLGTRLRPLTDTVPKALIPVSGEPLLDIQLRRLRQAGVTDVVVNVHHHADMVMHHLQTHPFEGLRIHISDEREALLDTGGGIRKAAPYFSADDSPFLVHNVDILSDVSLPDFYREGSAFDAALLVSPRPTQRYLLFDAVGRLVGWVNEKTGQIRSPYPGLQVADCRKLAFAGIHVFSPHLIPRMSSWPDTFSIIDFYLSICHEVHIQGISRPDLRILDIGKPETLSQAGDFLKSLM